MNKPKVAVVILTYNGIAFLEKFLPSVIANSEGHDIYVADNASTDNSIKYLRENFKSVKIIENKNNYGYAGGYNHALKSVNAEYYVLLNSDVEVTKGWIDPILQLMESDHKIAACQPKLLDHKNQKLFEYAGASGGFIDKYCYPFCRGRVFNSIEEDTGQYNDTTEIFWASGACLFVRAEAFWKVGGLDEDFFAHMEEIDLCWRMKNIGYSIFVVPQSHVFHVGGGTLNKYSSRKTFLNFRNNLITLTKNDSGKGLFFKIFYRMCLDGVAGVRFLLSGDLKHLIAVLKAHFAYYSMLPSTLRKRNAIKKLSEFKFNHDHIYNGNIVFEHFLKGTKKFTELRKSFFSE